jgi:N-acylneuraminate cytidylyltransferase
VENGAFYITSRKRLLDTRCRISGNIGLVEMPEETYFEIDEPADWMIAEALLKNSMKTKPGLKDKVQKIKCLLTDSDGVLNTKDGMGFKLLKERGFITGIITGENVEIVRRRAQKMKLDLVYLGIQDKMKAIDEICANLNLKYDEIAYIGDDINDLEVIKNVGLGCTVSDAMQCVKEAADYITRLNGGQGAVREVVELILNMRGSGYGLQKICSEDKPNHT